MDTKAITYATLILLMLAATFTAGAAVVSAVPLNKVPAPLQDVVIFLQYIFSVPVVVFVLTWVRGVYGYYRAKAKFGANVKYEVEKFGQTVALFVMIGIGAFAALPAPWNNVAVAIAFFVDIIKTEWSYYKAK